MSRHRVPIILNPLIVGNRDIALHSIGVFDLVADEVKVDGSGDLSERMIFANSSFQIETGNKEFVLIVGLASHHGNYFLA